MNRLQTFQQFLATQSVQIPMLGFALNLCLAALLGFILSQIYVRFGYSLSNRRFFAKNFMLLIMTTMVIITIVKSSLALSLGLVGALSIVRFRAAIKEPEELSYLFLCIAIGLGLGADQARITLVAFLIISLIICLRKFFRKSERSHNLYLTITSNDPEKTALDNIVEKMQDFCHSVKLRRFDETKEMLEACFLVEYDDFEQLKKCKTELRKLNDSMKITFLDSGNI